MTKLTVACRNFANAPKEYASHKNDIFLEHKVEASVFRLFPHFNQNPIATFAYAHITMIFTVIQNSACQLIYKHVEMQILNFSGL
jgi:hypothetical protein